MTNHFHFQDDFDPDAPISWRQWLQDAGDGHEHLAYRISVSAVLDWAKHQPYWTELAKTQPKETGKALLEERNCEKCSTADKPGAWWKSKLDGDLEEIAKMYTEIAQLDGGVSAEVREVVTRAAQNIKEGLTASRVLDSKAPPGFWTSPEVQGSCSGTVPQEDANFLELGPNRNRDDVYLKLLEYATELPKELAAWQLMDYKQTSDAVTRNIRSAYLTQATISERIADHRMKSGTDHGEDAVTQFLRSTLMNTNQVVTIADAARVAVDRYRPATGSQVPVVPIPAGTVALFGITRANVCGSTQPLTGEGRPSDLERSLTEMAEKAEYYRGLDIAGSIQEADEEAQAVDSRRARLSCLHGVKYMLEFLEGLVHDKERFAPDRPFVLRIHMWEGVARQLTPQAAHFYESLHKGLYDFYDHPRRSR
ncbi:unnamed protein product [Amoebophrya sp. A120]|nr:unnamed protein product [Amoebophrya sp. A120]|eukprot:GSA120T00022272001.1